MSNLATTESIKRFWDYASKEQINKYLWIPITGITISGVLDSFIKSIRENNYEAHIKIGDLVDMKLIPPKEQVTQ